MFSKSSELYDLIYSTKDYRSESNTIASILRSHHPDCTNVLDVACGTSEHHRFLSQEFNLAGIDLNAEFIEIASTKNPDGKYAVADMINFDLGKTYDAVICLFSSIGYVKTAENLKLALECFASHLNENGVLIIEPWIVPKDWKPGHIHMQHYTSEETKICRMSHASLEDQVSILDFEYLVGRSDGMQRFKERHELGLFDHNTMKSTIEGCGLHCDFKPEGLTGRGLYIGTRKGRRDVHV